MNKTLFKSRLCCIIIVLATLFAFMPTAKANPVTLEKAKLKAQQFLTANRTKSNSLNGKQTAVTFDLAYEAKTDDKSASCFYVLNESSAAGYIIISADDRLPDVLGYSDNGDFDIDKAPDNMKWWLSEYERQINQLLSTDKGEVATIDNTSFRDGWSEIEPLIKTKWNQGAPYNNLCPKVNGNSTYTGCVATAMAQIMNYHKWPEYGRGSNSYEWNGQTLSVDFSQTTFDWNNMQDTYSTNDSPTAQNAVATLMYACGVGTNMSYGVDESGANGYNATKALNTYFDYNARYLDKSAMDIADWENLVYNELANKRPVYYSGSSTTGSHAFVCDGYSNDGLFHINWGWGGFCDGYFLLDVLDPYNEGLAGADSEVGYKYSQSIIYGISPKNYDASGIEINETNFPDENFRNWLLEQDYGQDGIISDYEITGIASLSVSERNISNLKGIEFFTYLISLECSYNKLTTLDVSKNTLLTFLQCNDNQLTTLDVTKNTNLVTLYCYDNYLTTIDVSKNTALAYFSCCANRLTALDLSKNTALSWLNCDINQLTTLDLSKNTALGTLLCTYNQLTTLDLSKNTALYSISCYGNQLATLDVSGCTSLTELYCFNNNIYGTNMDALIASLPSCSNGSLYIYDPTEADGNICTKEQVAKIKELGWTPYYWSGDNWEEFEGREILPDVEINETNFPNKNFRNWLLEQDYGQDGIIDGYELAQIRSIYVSEQGIASLEGIENFSYLTTLDCSYNELTSLDITNNTALTWLKCNDNQLTTLDVYNNTALETLWCPFNKLTNLDITNNTRLWQLSCSSNQLTSLDLSNNTELYYLYCSYNELTSLDVSKNTALTYMDCDNNQLTTLEVSGCTALTYLYCDNNQIYGENMDKFITSLPVVDDSKIYLVDNSSSEKNACTKEQVAVIKEKGWTPYKYNYGWVEYEGSDDPTGIDATEMGNGDEIGANIVAYDLNGRRVEGWQSKKGVYIVGGKKVMVK